MIWLGVLSGIMAVLAVFVAYCAVRALVDPGRTPRLHADWARANLPTPDDTYALADDISVPLIEVVLDAERRAEPDWHPPPPKCAGAASRPGGIVRSPSPMMILVAGVKIELLPPPNCDDCEWVEATRLGSPRREYLRSYPCDRHAPKPTRPSPAREPEIR